MAVNALPSLDLSLRNLREAGRANDFHVPKSALRNDSENNAAAPARDPAADSIELSRDFPNLFINQLYQPPPPRQSSPVPGADNNRRDVNNGEEQQSNSANAGGAEGGGNPEEGDDRAVGDATDPQGRPLDDSEQRQLAELKERDQEVRTHEQAHKAAGGQYAGAVSYDYQQGPDGARYAVGGEVSIDVSPEKDPAATMAKMRQVRSAALAPAEPSSQDRSVASQAMQQETEARNELQEQQARPSGGAAAGADAENQDGENAGGAENASGASNPASGSAAASSRPNSGVSASGTAASDNAPSSTPTPVAPARLSSASPYGGASSFASRASLSAASAFGYTPIDVFA